MAPPSQDPFYLVRQDIQDFVSTLYAARSISVLVLPINLLSHNYPGTALALLSLMLDTKLEMAQISDRLGTC
jgi:hypothetical protein